MMELTITSMTPADRLYAYNQAICAGILAVARSFTLPGSTTEVNTRQMNLRRNSMRWSTLCGRRTGCFSVGAA